MPIGDSITRGSYLARYEEGPYRDTPVGLPHSLGGGYRKHLQDMLRAAGFRFEFVGQLDLGAYGQAGRTDPEFSPWHQGVPGWGNRDILRGRDLSNQNAPRVSPDIFDRDGGKTVAIKDIATVVQEFRPDVILLMSGSNGHDAPAADELVRVLLAHFPGPLLIATIPPQRPPRPGWEKTEAYNRALSETAARLAAGGFDVHLVNVHEAVSKSQLLPDGVHPDAEGMKAIARAFFGVLELVLKHRCLPPASP